MTVWRRVVAILVLALLGPPLVAVVAELIRTPSAWGAWRESGRLFNLAANTFVLTTSVLAVVLPPGLFAALLLHRSDLPGRHFLRRIIVVALFVPLPLLASAWQSTLGSGGWLAWKNGPWEPWRLGMPGAIIVHAMAGFPWIVWIAGRGFMAVERPLEEDAVLHGGVWAALRHATIPRAMPAIAAAALWVALQTATEVAATDMAKVRTFAEEVYTQFASPDPDPTGRGDGLARAVAVAVPFALLTGLAIGFAVRRWERRLPPLAESSEPFLLIRLGRWRGPALIAVTILIAIVVGIPIFSLFRQTGLVASGQPWSAGVARQSFAAAYRVHHRIIVRSLIWAMITGVAVSALALLACWLGRERHWLRAGMLVLLTLAWTLPGPVVGIGLKEAINGLMDVEEFISGEGVKIIDKSRDPKDIKEAAYDSRVDIMRLLLYDGPSPLPVMWAAAVRFLPVAVILLWPAVRAVPRELIEAARLDGATPAEELRLAIVPSVAPAFLRAVLAVAALSLGEMSAGKLVVTPGEQTLATAIFQMMHYGVERNLAAMCLILLGLIVAILIGGWWGLARRGGEVVRW